MGLQHFVGEGFQSFRDSAVRVQRGLGFRVLDLGACRLAFSAGV